MSLEFTDYEAEAALKSSTEMPPPTPPRLFVPWLRLFPNKTSALTGFTLTILCPSDAAIWS